MCSAFIPLKSHKLRHCNNHCIILYVSIKPSQQNHIYHDDILKWKHFLRYWPFVRGIHRSPVNSLHKGQWLEALIFSVICAWTNGRVNMRDGDLRRHRAHYYVTVMLLFDLQTYDICRYNANIISDMEYGIHTRSRPLLYAAISLKCCFMTNIDD